MKILITAGGTSEKIDEVRQISNTSTGALGVKIAESFLACGKSVDKIYYVCGSGALAPPFSEKIELHRAVSVADVERALESVFSRSRIDAVVHCMAVSDFTKKNVTTVGSVAAFLCDGLRDSADLTEDGLRQLVAQALGRDAGIESGGKINSDTEDLVLVLKKTPKLIACIRQAQPQAVLVGFKLLNHVGQETLFAAARELMDKNSCNFVFANDTKDITPDSHSGYLLSRDGSYQSLHGKSEIARQIVSAVMDELRGAAE